MTKETLIDKLGNKIKDGCIVIGIGITVDIDSFLQMFGGCDWDYDQLIAEDGDTKGYKPFFDQCKADGLFN